MSTEMPPDSLNIPPESIFAFRLMYAECSYGSMQHPLNVAEEGGGHGVLYGPEEQPLLNANDWVRFLYKGIIINHNKNRANLH
mgnify:CR=1 FL=1